MALPKETYNFNGWSFTNINPAAQKTWRKSDSLVLPDDAQHLCELLYLACELLRENSHSDQDWQHGPTFFDWRSRANKFLEQQEAKKESHTHTHDWKQHSIRDNQFCTICGRQDYDVKPSLDLSTLPTTRRLALIERRLTEAGL